MALSPKYPDYDDEEIVEWLCKMYAKGRTLDFIAEKSGINRLKVRRILLQQGIDMRRRGRGIVVNDETKLRRCKDCGAELPLDEFYRDRTKHFGRGYRCKTCDRLRSTPAAVDD